MERLQSVFPVALFCALLAFSPLAPAANSFKIDDVTLPCGATQVVVPVLADVDQDVLGLSVSLEYDRSKMRISSVELGSDIDALDPEWNDGVVDNTAGFLSYGVVFDLSGPDVLEKPLSAGDNLEILVLTVDWVASSPTTATLDFKNVDPAGDDPIRWNVMTDENGDSISPGPTLDSGDLIQRDLSPRIDSLSSNSGNSQQPSTFFIVGANFDQPGLEVTVGGAEADDVVVLNAQNLQVTIETCNAGANPPNQLPVQVCTACGCDTASDTFECSGPPVPVITGYPLGSEKEPGEILMIAGANFGEPGLVVTVCGQEVAATLIGLEDSIQVTVPDCADQSGCVPIVVTNQWGSDTDPDGLCFPPPPVPRITGYPLGNEDKREGDTILIAGQNFDQPGLEVTICGQVVAASIIGLENSIQLDLPACAAGSWASVEVCTDIGCCTNLDCDAGDEEGGIFYSGGTLFIRGNANNSSDNVVDLSDAVAVFNDLFLGIPSPAPCRDALDANDDGATDISDGVWILAFLFQGGPAIKPPWPDPGLDPTPDELPDC
jgi:hypothetical protein